MTRQPKNTAARSLAKYSLLALFLVGSYLYTLTLPVSRKEDFVSFEVKKGESITQIATNLKNHGLIRSPLYFKLVTKIKKLSLQAGIYELSPAHSSLSHATSLTRGRSLEKKLTIPEGYRREQIAQAANLSISEFLLASKGLEGSLFPDTYFVKEGITPTELVKIMHDNFVKKVGAVDTETLILASLVERETKSDAEKPVVAGILKKRLAAGWPLELDASIQYVLGKPGNWWPNTTILDRKVNSLYNTYLHPGLPPTPIGNPGLASINAVRNAEDSPYWFYLHDDQGTIHYAATLAEHNQNIDKYIR